MNLLKTIITSTVIVRIITPAWAQFDVGLYRYKSSSKLSNSNYLIVDDDTAYSYWMYPHHYIRYSTVDTLYRQGNKYIGKKGELAINDGELWYYQPGGRKKRVHEAGEHYTNKWLWMHKSVAENPVKDYDHAIIIKQLYEQYSPLLEKE